METELARCNMHVLLHQLHLAEPDRLSAVVSYFPRVPLIH